MKTLSILAVIASLVVGSLAVSEPAFARGHKHSGYTSEDGPVSPLMLYRHKKGS